MLKVMKPQMKHQSSSVGKKFVQLIGKAAISCSNLQGLGAAVVQDGLGKWDDLCEFAAIGKHGRFLGNAERDFHSKFRKLHGQWISTTHVAVPKLVRKTGLVAIRQAKVLYPHELWAHLSQDSKRFNEVFMPGSRGAARVLAEGQRRGVDDGTSVAISDFGFANEVRPHSDLWRRSPDGQAR